MIPYHTVIRKPKLLQMEIKADCSIPRSHLQNPSTDVSATGLTFHPVLGVVICLAVRHAVSENVKNIDEAAVTRSADRGR